MDQNLAKRFYKLSKSINCFGVTTDMYYGGDIKHSILLYIIRNIDDPWSLIPIFRARKGYKPTTEHPLDKYLYKTIGVEPINRYCRDIVLVTGSLKQITQFFQKQDADIGELLDLIAKNRSLTPLQMYKFLTHNVCPKTHLIFPNIKWYY